MDRLWPFTEHVFRWSRNCITLYLAQFCEQFSKKKWLKEMAGQREILAAYGGVNIEDIRGMRAPFLAIGGKMFSMLYDANFTYDSSMPI